MKESELIKIITNSIGSDFIGDDCAYLKELNIVVSQDSLIEKIHFRRDWYTPYQLGYKSVIVNISDILASGAEPAYITIALSLPNDINSSFIKEFYNGAKAALHGAIIVGGDLTGSESNIFISITAIGRTNNRNISSRKNAKVGYGIVTHGLYGSSALGLEELSKGIKKSIYIDSHIEPKLCHEFSKSISTIVTEPYAMMDTSDGLADALYKIADASCVKISVDYEKIPHTSDAKQNHVLFGGEDYNLVAAVPLKYVNKIPNAILIGAVLKNDGIKVDVSGKHFNNYSEIKSYNHFEQQI